MKIARNHCRGGGSYPRSFSDYRVSVLASGSLTIDLMRNVLSTLRREDAWQIAPHTEEVASTIFAVGLRAAAAASHFVHLPFTGYPHKLVDLLYPHGVSPETHADWEEKVAQFLSMPPCYMDSFSLQFRSQFSTSRALQSEMCQQMLHAVTRQLECSTYSTERLHSGTARRCRARTSTHSASLAQIALEQVEAIPHGCNILGLW